MTQKQKECKHGCKADNCGNCELGGRDTKKKKCDHDFKNIKRYGWTDWRCPKCGKDIFMYLLLAFEAKRKTKNDNNHPLATLISYFHEFKEYLEKLKK